MTPPEPESARTPRPDDARASREAAKAAAATGAPGTAKAPVGAAQDEGAGENVAEVAELEAKVAALEDRLRRQQADFLNDVRRIQRLSDERARFAVQPVVEDLLGVADALHGAIEGLSDSEHEKRVGEGLRMVERELLDVLGRHGVARIDAMNKPFDPAVHEAVMEMDGPSPERTVLQVTRPGFTLHGRVVRPAHVVVSKGKKKGDASPPAAPESED
jgi:molecular chaperone GrpE